MLESVGRKSFFCLPATEAAGPAGGIFDDHDFAGEAELVAADIHDADAEQAFAAWPEENFHDEFAGGEIGDEDHDDDADAERVNVMGDEEVLGAGNLSPEELMHRMWTMLRLQVPIAPGVLSAVTVIRYMINLTYHFSRIIIGFRFYFKLFIIIFVFLQRKIAKTALSPFKTALEALLGLLFASFGVPKSFWEAMCAIFKSPLVNEHDIRHLRSFAYACAFFFFN